MFLRSFRIALVMTGLFTLLCGILYPLAITGVAQLFFPAKANGSLIMRKGSCLGSELIGQSFHAAWYFWGRPSATKPFPYNAASSAGSNEGPLNPVLIDSVKARAEGLKAEDPGNLSAIPVDLVTSSGSGLDPEISVASALYQARRVARARAISEEKIRALIREYTEGRGLGFLGERRVNVLRLNLALDDLAAPPGRK